jgi:hypothetical protein
LSLKVSSLRFREVLLGKLVLDVPTDGPSDAQGNGLPHPQKSGGS